LYRQENKQLVVIPFIISFYYKIRNNFGGNSSKRGKIFTLKESSELWNNFGDNFSKIGKIFTLKESSELRNNFAGNSSKSGKIFTLKNRQNYGIILGATLPKWQDFHFKRIVRITE
jgi:hypothetical protein